MSLTDFTFDAYRAMLRLMKDRIMPLEPVLEGVIQYLTTEGKEIFFTLPSDGRMKLKDDDGNQYSGLMIRHDVDDDIPRALAMAHAEAVIGVYTTYYILNTAPYWGYGEDLDMIKEIQDLGHRIGWHNNALTEWIQSDYKRPLKKIISEPIERMRSYGIEIRSTVGHGDKLCYEHGYLNNYIWGYSKKPGFPGINNPTYSLEEFGLEFDASHIRNNGYLSESGKKWSADPDDTIRLWYENNKRYQLLIHPQHWTL